MTKTNRPHTVTIIAWIMIVFGAVAVVYGIFEWQEAKKAAVGFDTRPLEIAVVVLLRVVAIGCGAFLLFGFNWARWLAMVWFVFHVVLGMLHSPFALVVHLPLAVVVCYFLTRPNVIEYFKPSASRS